MKEPERREALEGLYKALKEKNLPGVKLELDSNPVVYTEHTCTRVRARCYVIDRVSPHGHVLETASLGVNRQGLAVRVIQVMTGLLSL
jgi:hypothetical protein